MRDRSIPETAAAVRGGEVSAVDVTFAALERAEQAQPMLNAFTSIDVDGALAAARAVDDAVGRGEDPGPLAGVPVALKDLIDHEGRPNTRGSSAPPFTAGSSAPCVERLEAAGAVVIGRTGLHEYAFGFSSENHWFGPVRNPWDVTLSPGGSSGGSGAAISAGLVPAALGTDTGGSVRVPAALCGVVGLKVTHGRVPLRGVYPLAPPLDTVGPLARSVADCAAIYEVIAGDDALDPWSVPVSVESARSPADLAGLAVGVPHPWMDVPVAAEQGEAFTAFLDGLADAGAQISDIEVPHLEPSTHSVAGVLFEAAHIHRSRYEATPEQYGTEVRDRIASAVEVTPQAYMDALEWRRAARAAALRAFRQVDVLVTPTVASLRKTIGDDEVDLNGEATHYIRAMSMFTAPVNNTGLPALAMPLPGPSRPPPSAQIIGPAWSEARLLEIGLGLEIAELVTTQRPPHWQPSIIDANPARGA